MARYFFHLHDHTENRDLDGSDWPSLHIAKTVAASDLHQLANYDLQLGRRVSVQRIDIADESGKVLESVGYC